MSDTRLIERWLPIGALGEESTRERRSMTALPPTYYLHVWWARRPLVASRAAVLASLLPAEADRERFLRVCGIHGDPVATRRRIDAAKRSGKHLGANPYGYKRAFSYLPDEADVKWVETYLGKSPAAYSILDPTAGGGSIPFEIERLGAATLANDLNPVAALVLEATVDWPRRHGAAVLQEFEKLASDFIRRAEPKYAGVFPAEAEGVRVEGYLWARTITCPYCEGRVPLAPNWRLAPDGTGVRLEPDLGGGPGEAGRVCRFRIVREAREQSEGTVARGRAACPWPDCRRVIGGDEIKAQAQAGRMGEQLFAVVYKEQVITETKTGRRREKWVRRYRAPRPEDDNSAAIAERLAEKLPEWEAYNLIPTEQIPDGTKTSEPLRYGMRRWRDLFSPRQLLCHCTGVEVFRELLEADRAAGALSPLRQAAYGYLAIALDTLLNYDNRAGRWDSTTGRVRSIFDRHDFAFVWSYAEMAPLVTGVGYDWAIDKTTKCVRELVALVRPGADAGALFPDAETPRPPVTVTCKSGDALDHVAAGSIDAVVMDPPYYDNVMYAELSDFFYVWLKRTAGQVFPELFRLRLTDKESEAVANPARFRGEAGAGGAGARALAGRDYQERMQWIFEEMRRVLKPNGVMTLMFTHKATGAWDALTGGLMEAGFAITASWPINTEAEGSLHVRNKAAANSTIFLACRPRTAERQPDAENVYWEDIEPRVADAVRERVAEYQAAGIRGVDLYLACFGPALEEFSRHWPLTRGRPRPKPQEESRRRGRQPELLDAEPGLYEVTPEDVLDTARREVKRWRLEQLTHRRANADLDPPTAFFVLAWDAFDAPAFAYDEALRLARAVGVDLDREIVGRLAEKKGSELRLWDSARRAAAGTLGPKDGSRGMIDVLHRAADLGRTGTLGDARDMLNDHLGARERSFLAALEAVLEVLPVTSHWTKVELPSEAAPAGDDFDALYHLMRLEYSDRIDEPEQLKLWQDDAADAEN